MQFPTLVKIQHFQLKFVDLYLADKQEKLTSCYVLKTKLKVTKQQKLKSSN